MSKNRKGWKSLEFWAIFCSIMSILGGIVGLVSVILYFIGIGN